MEKITFFLKFWKHFYMIMWSAAAAKSLQLCPTLHNPIDGSLPGSSVHGILQARILEWGAISFSSAWKWKVKVKSLSRARLLATPWTAAHQAPASMGFSRQDYWSGLPFPWTNVFPTSASLEQTKSCLQLAEMGLNIKENTISKRVSCLVLLHE